MEMDELVGATSTGGAFRVTLLTGLRDVFAGFSALAIPDPGIRPEDLAAKPQSSEDIGYGPDHPGELF